MYHYRLSYQISLASLLLLIIFCVEWSDVKAQQSGSILNSQTANEKPSLTDYQKESLNAIKEMTSNLLFLAVGVFALVGGYLSKEAKGFKGKRVLKYSFLCFGLSLLAGLIVYMSLIEQLQAQEYDPNSVLVRTASVLQIVAIAIGALLFYFFLTSNIKDEK